MSKIEVKEPSKNSSSYHVSVSDGASTATFRVGVPEDFYSKLTSGKISKIDCLKASFRFLLDREPKESILQEFELSVISRYFPEFEREFKKYTEK